MHLVVVMMLGILVPSIATGFAEVDDTEPVRAGTVSSHTQDGAEAGSAWPGCCGVKPGTSVPDTTLTATRSALQGHAPALPRSVPWLSDPGVPSSARRLIAVTR